MRRTRLKQLDPAERARPFRATRKQHVNEAAEDYTELVADLIEKNGEARTGTIAEHLGISHVTALRTIRRLQSEGFLQTSPHQPVDLTKKGEALAAHCKRRHILLLEFFIRIGVPEEVAEIDVEGLEHHISETSLAAIERFLGERDAS
jgi:DtxR family manganese transport transcriptional regulator